MDDFKEALENLENNINHFQNNLQCIRTLLDITMTEAGELLGVSRQSIMALEAKQTKMTILQYVGLKSAFYRIYKHTFSTEEKKNTIGILNALIGPTLLFPFGIVGTAAGTAATYASSRLQKKIFKQDISLINSLKTTYGGEDAEEILENALSLRDINNFYDICHKKTREQRSNFSKEKEVELKRKEVELKRKEEELKRKEEELKRQIEQLDNLTKSSDPISL